MKIKFGFGNTSEPKDNRQGLGKRRPQLSAPRINNSPPDLRNKDLFVSRDKLKCIKDLDKLVGLENVKELFEEIYSFVKIDKRRQQEGLVSTPMVFHMIFKGNPGTGKTTVARLMGKFFRELGLLEKGHLHEVERADLVGEYVGHTAQKTRDQIRKSLGGVLFIDEAYSLARGGGRDFGREAIDALVKSMEDYRKELVIILAGYKEEMDLFIESNPGLRSRFPIQLEFQDFSVVQLTDIAMMMFGERQFFLTPQAEKHLETIINEEALDGHRYSGNGRFVRNLVEKTIRNQALRLAKSKSLTREQLILVEACDLPASSYKIKRNDTLVSYEMAKRMLTPGG